MTPVKQYKQRPLSRRHFLRWAAIATAGMLASRCTPPPSPPPTVAPSDTPFPTDVPPPTATAITPPTNTPLPPTGTTAPPATATATAAAPTATTAPTATAKSARVSIARAISYEPKVIHDRVRTLLDNIGGISDIVRPGARVAIKVNLTGGTSAKWRADISPMDSYVTHPEVVRALGGFLRDAGAAEIFIVEAVYEWASFTEWGYEAVARDIGATLIDLNATQPYSDFATVAAGHHIYADFTFNHILHDIDTFVSVAKMKCHWCCGVTHALKNLVGLVPARFYRLSEEHSHRSAFHGPAAEFSHRLPRVIMDLNQARPIHLALIDGIKTTEGGEGPWIQSLAPVEPGVLIAGKDPVATDAVATAVQGFDPNATGFTVPFLRSDNYLAMAASLGLGTHVLDDIAVSGTPIADVVYPFEACWE